MAAPSCQLREIRVGDRLDAWTAAGFSAVDGQVIIGSTAIVPSGAGRGITALALDGCVSGAIDGKARSTVSSRVQRPLRLECSGHAGPWRFPPEVTDAKSLRGLNGPPEERCTCRWIGGSELDISVPIALMSPHPRSPLD